MRFLSYVAKRLVLMVITLFGVLVITFSLAHLVPADPIATITGGQAPPEVIDRIKERMGLMDPLYVQFVRYIRRIFSGDLGTSIATKHPVTQDLKEKFPATIELATTAMLISIIIGIPLGMISAVKRDELTDHGARIFSLVGNSMPAFWLGLILLLIFYYYLDLLPGGGQLNIFMDRPPRRTGLMTIDAILAGDYEAFLNYLKHLILPAFVLGYIVTASIARITRSSMLEALQQEYVRTARAKGLREWVVIYRHALRNALIPTTTVIGLSFGGLLEGSVLTETIFSWPGLGRYITGATLSLDFPAVMGGMLLIAVVYSLANLVVDLVYALINPRIRYG